MTNMAQTTRLASWNRAPHNELLNQQVCWKETDPGRNKETNSSTSGLSGARTWATDEAIGTEITQTQGNRGCNFGTRNAITKSV